MSTLLRKIIILYPRNVTTLRGTTPQGSIRKRNIYICVSICKGCAHRSSVRSDFRGLPEEWPRNKLRRHSQGIKKHQQWNYMGFHSRAVKSLKTFFDWPSDRGPWFSSSIHLHKHRGSIPCQTKWPVYRGGRTSESESLLYKLNVFK